MSAKISQESSRSRVIPLDRCETECVEPERVAAVLARLPDERVFQDLAETFRVLSDPGRVRLISALLEAGELCVCDLAAVTRLSQTACSHNLRLLRSSRLVRYRKRGRNVYVFRKRTLRPINYKEVAEQASLADRAAREFRSPPLRPTGLSRRHRWRPLVASVGAAGLAHDLAPADTSGRRPPERGQGHRPSGWRIYTVAATMPRFDPSTWRLKVDGLVEHPLALSYAELRALPRVEQTSEFHCVTGWSVKNVRWTGVRFQDLLAAARPLAVGRALAFVSAERPYVDSLTLQQANLPDVLLAYEMDGKPLSRPHGARVRVVIPDMYGYKNVKWVERIVVTPRPVSGYWEVRGYDENAWVGHSNNFG